MHLNPAKVMLQSDFGSRPSARMKAGSDVKQTEQTSRRFADVDSPAQASRAVWPTCGDAAPG